MNENQKFQSSKGGVFSLKGIVFDKKPVLHVTHDIGGDWQFLGQEDADENEIVFVHASHLVETDGTLNDIQDLPEGWHAWRLYIGDEWKREKMADDYSEV